jgi:hypothetical protein
VSKLISVKKLIVDANILGIFFQSKDFHPVHKAFLEKRWLLSYGGTKQLEEYARVQIAFTLILELQRSGRAFKEETEEIKLTNARRSTSAFANQMTLISLHLHRFQELGYFAVMTKV